MQNEKLKFRFSIKDTLESLKVDECVEIDYSLAQLDVVRSFASKYKDIKFSVSKTGEGSSIVTRTV